MIALRPHQIGCCDALEACGLRRAIASITVSGGKSLIAAELARRHDGRVLILTHTAELVKQNLAAAAQLGVNAVPYSASIGKNRYGRVTVGTIQSLARKLECFADVTRIIIDEVHRVSSSEKSQYQQLLDALPKAHCYGLTGTPFRATGSLSFFGPVVYEFGFARALELGYVKPLVPLAADAPSIDTEGAKISRATGDFKVADIEHHGLALAAQHAAAATAALQADGRQRVIVFAIDVTHAEALAEEMTALGWHAASITYKTPAGLRKHRVADFRSGALDVLVSVEAFSTGFSVDDVDALVWCRPTQSAVLYTQGLGRGARKSSIVDDCAVIDFGGNTARLGAMDMIDVSGEERDRAIKLLEPDRLCAACLKEYARFLGPTCPHCGHDQRVARTVGRDLTQSAKSRALLEGGEAKWLALAGPGRRVGPNLWVVPLAGGVDCRWLSRIAPDQTFSHAYVRRGPRGMVAEGLWHRELQRAVSP